MSSTMTESFNGQFIAHMIDIPETGWISIDEFLAWDSERHPTATCHDKPNPEDDVLHWIDELVDEQLSQYDSRSGYDYNVNQEQCPHCWEDWHTLPIKERMREIRRLWHNTIAYGDASAEAVAALDSYRYDQDDSPIICPGSDAEPPPNAFAPNAFDFIQRLINQRLQYQVPPLALVNRNAMPFDRDGEITVEWDQIYPHARPGWVNDVDVPESAASQILEWHHQWMVTRYGTDDVD